MPKTYPNLTYVPMTVEMKPFIPKRPDVGGLRAQTIQKRTRAVEAKDTWPYWALLVFSTGINIFLFVMGIIYKKNCGDSLNRTTYWLAIIGAGCVGFKQFMFGSYVYFSWSLEVRVDKSLHTNDKGVYTDNQETVIEKRKSETDERQALFEIITPIYLLATALGATIFGDLWIDIPENHDAKNTFALAVVLVYIFDLLTTTVILVLDYVHIVKTSIWMLSRSLAIGALFVLAWRVQYDTYAKHEFISSHELLTTVLGTDSESWTASTNLTEIAIKFDELVNVASTEVVDTNSSFVKLLWWLCLMSLFFAHTLSAMYRVNKKKLREDAVQFTRDSFDEFAPRGNPKRTSDEKKTSPVSTIVVLGEIIFTTFASICALYALDRTRHHAKQHLWIYMLYGITTLFSHFVWALTKLKPPVAPAQEVAKSATESANLGGGMQGGMQGGDSDYRL